MEKEQEFLSYFFKFLLKLGKNNLIISNKIIFCSLIKNPQIP